MAALRIQSALLTDQACRRLLEGILDGRWPAGTKLVETALSRDLGVSRTPVREALARLTQEGFVAYAPRRGHRVRPVSRKDVDDLFDLRGELERLAFRKAFARITPDDLRRLQARQGPADPSRDEAGRAAALASDDRLHDLFCRRCDNRYLEEYLKRLVRLSRPYRWFGAEAPARSRELQAQRRRILAAIAARQPRKAETLLVRHIREGRREILRRLAFPPAPHTPKTPATVNPRPPCRKR